MPGKPYTDKGIFMERSSLTSGRSRSTEETGGKDEDSRAKALKWGGPKKDRGVIDTARHSNSLSCPPELLLGVQGGYGGSTNGL